MLFGAGLNMDSLSFSDSRSVPASLVSIPLCPANYKRSMATITNDDTVANLYVLLGDGDASTTRFTIKIPPRGYYEFPVPAYKGKVSGIWDSATGSARITEY